MTGGGRREHPLDPRAKGKEGRHSSPSVLIRSERRFQFELIGQMGVAMDHLHGLVFVCCHNGHKSVFLRPNIFMRNIVSFVGDTQSR